MPHSCGASRAGCHIKQSQLISFAIELAWHLLNEIENAPAYQVHANGGIEGWVSGASICLDDALCWVLKEAEREPEAAEGGEYDKRECVSDDPLHNASDDHADSTE